MITADKNDFIREIIDEDILANVNERRVHTRFPPEPNGYLHIGHAKSILLNYGIAKDFNGKFNVRFDDTNPEKEEQEYVDSIIEDVKWLGAKFEDRLFYASDYFEQMYQYAVDLIKKGKAYVCDLNGDEIRANSRHIDGTRQGKPLSKPECRRKSRFVRTDAKRRIPQRNKDTAR